MRKGDYVVVMMSMFLWWEYVNESQALFFLGVVLILDCIHETLVIVFHQIYVLSEEKKKR